MPGRNDTTSLPTSSTMPLNSWPIVTGGVEGKFAVEKVAIRSADAASLDPHKQIVGTRHRPVQHSHRKLSPRPRGVKPA